MEHDVLFSLRLFCCDEDSGDEMESEGSNLNAPAPACPSYAATAALPTTVPVTATLTGKPWGWPQACGSREYRRHYGGWRVLYNVAGVGGQSIM